MRAALPSERYHLLPPGDRIAILQFLCQLATSSKSVHLYMESCEEQLTAFRKEKIEVNRQKKQLYVFFFFSVAPHPNRGDGEHPGIGR